MVVVMATVIRYMTKQPKGGKVYFVSQCREMLSILVGKVWQREQPATSEDIVPCLKGKR